MKRLFLYLSIFLLFLSCKKENAGDCFKSNGKEIKEVRLPGEFDEISIVDKFDVQVFQGTECKVEIVAGKNVIDNIKTVLEGRHLIVTNNNKCNFVRGYKRKMQINIFLPHVKTLLNDGVGAVNFSENFNQDSISVRVANSGDVHLNGTYRTIKTSSNGNGDMYISGKAKNLYVYTNGINYVDARGLSVSEYMFIHSVTIGDCYVNATGTKKLDYNIQKEGNIYYTGDPGMINNFSEEGLGSGQLIKQ